MNISLITRRFLSRLGLRKKLTVILSLDILLAVFAVSVINQIRSTEYFARQTIEQTDQLLEQIGINVDTYLEELFRLTLAPYYNDDVMAALERRPETEAGELEKTRIIETFLASIMTIPRNDVLRVYIFTGDGLYYSGKTAYRLLSGFDYTSENWYREALITDGPVFLQVFSEQVFTGSETRLFSIVQKLRSKNDSSKTIGVIRVDANYRGIQSVCDKVRIEGNDGLYIADSVGNIIYRKEHIPPESLAPVLNAVSNTIMVRNTPYLLNSRPLRAMDWRLVAVHDYGEINRYAIITRNAALFAALICTLVAVALLFAAINGFLRPMRQVVNLMREVEYGAMDARFRGKGEDEIGYLGDSFNRMLDRLNDSMRCNTQLTREVFEAQYLWKEAQYNVLCNQIQPHFIYNALNTISLLVKCGAAKDAVDTIEKLSYYLRGVMSSSNNIPLESELKIVDSYLGLQQSRYRTRLQYRIMIDKRFMRYEIPALSLQPLVENAVVHGFESSGGSVDIQLYSIDGDTEWYLCVRDTGGGINADALKDLQARLAQQDELKDENQFVQSIGLINVNRRIRLKYGEGYGLQVESVLGEGTLVTLRLPRADLEDICTAL
jgi:two-component system sensor histidine kinase YesM